MNTIDDRVLDQVPVSELKASFRTLRLNFRWPVHPVPGNERQVELAVPVTANGAQILNAAFVGSFKLSQAEVERAEDAVLRQIAVLPES